MNFYKKTLPLALAFCSGWIAIILDIIPHQYSERTMTEIDKGLILISALTAFMGVYSLLGMHWDKIRRHLPGWGYSLMVIIGFWLMTLLGIYNNGQWLFQPQVEGAGGVNWLYLYVFTPCQATMFSILAFFIASAAYRTFRAKSWEAAILLVAAVIVMFGKVPISTAIWQGFPDTAQWLLDYPNLAVKRAIYFGIALGGISTSLRIIFGIERSYLGGGDA